MAAYRGSFIGPACALALAAIAVPTRAEAQFFEPWFDRPMFERPLFKPRRPKRPPAERVQAPPTKPQGSLTKPQGPLQIVISVAEQRLWLYDNGALMAQAPVSTGTAIHPTPMGVFSIIQKNRFHRSNIYSNAPMPFMQRITWSGVALHQGHLPGYPASHGCVRMPEAFARDLFGITRLGARVVIASHSVAPMAITHARLFQPREQAPMAGTADVPIRTAAATLTANDAAPAVDFGEAASDGAFFTAIPAIDVGIAEVPTVNEPVRVRDADVMEKEASRRSGPVSVFVSRKKGRLYLRQNFDPVFDVPVAIAAPDQPLGTHVFTAMGSVDGRIRWTVLSLPSEQGPAPEPTVRGKAAQKAPPPVPVARSAAAALDRIGIPAQVRERIEDLVTPGFSLIVSDQGLGDETGLGTDFIVVTR